MALRIGASYRWPFSVCVFSMFLGKTHSMSTSHACNIMVYFMDTLEPPCNHLWSEWIPYCDTYHIRVVVDI